jgi:hypothetical protein
VKVSVKDVVGHADDLACIDVDEQRIVATRTQTYPSGGGSRPNIAKLEIQ